MKHRGVTVIVWQLAFQTEKEIHGAWPPVLNLPELASHHLGVALQGTLSINARAGTRQTLSPCMKGCILIPVSGAGTRGTL